MTSARLTSFDPWGPISSLLFEWYDSDEIQTIVGLAGLALDRGHLTEQEALYESNRKRVYRERINTLYSELSADLKQRFIINIAKQIADRLRFKPGNKDRIKEILKNIGWSLVEDGLQDRLVNINLISPSDLLTLPKAAHKDLLKAAERLPDDVCGAITSACGAVESTCSQICESHELKDLSFQDKVKKALNKVKSLEYLKGSLIDLGWEEKKADMVCNNLKGAVNQAAYVMQSLRSDMGDVHGSKPYLSTLGFDSIKWAMIISSLLQWERKTSENLNSGSKSNWEF